MVLSSFWEYDFFPLITHVACELITVTVRQEASALVHSLYISPSLQPVLLPVAFGASSSFCRTRCGRSCWTCAHQSRWELTKMWHQRDRTRWHGKLIWNPLQEKGNVSKYRFCLLCGLCQRWCFKVSAISARWPRRKKRYWCFLSLLVSEWSKRHSCSQTSLTAIKETLGFTRWQSCIDGQVSLNYQI